MTVCFVYLAREGESVNSQWKEEDSEEAFFTWWERIETYQDQYSVRMIFDAGFRAGMESDK